MSSRAVLILGLILFGGAVYALHTDKMRVITICRDSRLYMEGGVDTEIEGGGLNYHHVTKLFKRKNNKDIFMSEFLITSETPSSSPEQTLMSGSSLKLSIFKNQKQSEFGYPGHLDATANGEKISVNVNCMNKNI